MLAQQVLQHVGRDHRVLLQAVGQVLAHHEARKCMHDLPIQALGGSAGVRRIGDCWRFSLRGWRFRVHRSHSQMVSGVSGLGLVRDDLGRARHRFLKAKIHLAVVEGVGGAGQHQQMVVSRWRRLCFLRVEIWVLISDMAFRPSRRHPPAACGAKSLPMAGRFWNSERETCPVVILAGTRIAPLRHAPCHPPGPCGSLPLARPPPEG